MLGCGADVGIYMVQVETDTVRNVLRIGFSQDVDEAQAQRCQGEIEAALREMQPGFRVLTDLSGLASMDIACAEAIRWIMDLCRHQGVAEIVRIISDPQEDIGFQLMSHAHYARQVSIITYTTLAEGLRG